MVTYKLRPMDKKTFDDILLIPIAEILRDYNVINFYSKPDFFEIIVGRPLTFREKSMLKKTLKEKIDSFTLEKA